MSFTFPLDVHVNAMHYLPNEQGDMDMDANLKILMNTERKAFRAMMNGSEADARTVYGEEGKNYLAWSAAADAERAYRISLEDDGALWGRRSLAAAA